MSFRELVDLVDHPDRGTHLLHRYPAKLLPHIPVFFLASRSIRSQATVVCDPFCGSGTVLLEGLLSGLRVVGADSNPLARLVAKAKCTWVDPDLAMSTAGSAIGSLPGKAAPPPIANIEHWFTPKAIKGLARLRAALMELDDEPLRDFLLVCFSAAVQRVSLADPRISVPVRLAPDKYRQSRSLAARMSREYDRRVAASPKDEFLRVVRENAERMRRLAPLRELLSGPRILDDARALRMSDDEACDLVITSPPYLGAQKYIRASSLSLGWLGMTPERSLSDLKTSSIGREFLPRDSYAALSATGLPDVDNMLQEVFERSPLRAEMAATYVNEMRVALTSITHTTRPTAKIVLVAGNNVLSGAPFPTADVLERLLLELGWTLRLRVADRIHSRGLLTKRHRSASIIQTEMVSVLERGGEA